MVDPTQFGICEVGDYNSIPFHLQNPKKPDLPDCLKKPTLIQNPNKSDYLKTFRKEI